MIIYKFNCNRRAMNYNPFITDGNNIWQAMEWELLDPLLWYIEINGWEENDYREMKLILNAECCNPSKHGFLPPLKYGISVPLKHGCHSMSIVFILWFPEIDKLYSTPSTPPKSSPSLAFSIRSLCWHSIMPRPKTAINCLLNLKSLVRRSRAS